MPGDLGRLPHRALGRLTVAEQHEHAGVGAEHPRAQREPHAGAQPLAERAGGDVHEGQPGRRMSLEVARQLAQGRQLLALEDAQLGPHRVEQRRGVTLAEHEAIAERRARVVGIQAHRGEEQGGDELGRRGGAGGVAAARCRGGPDRVDAQARGDVFERLDEPVR